MELRWLDSCDKTWSWAHISKHRKKFRISSCVFPCLRNMTTNSSSQVNVMKTTDYACWQSSFLQVFKHKLRILNLPILGIITDGYLLNDTSSLSSWEKGDNKKEKWWQTQVKKHAIRCWFWRLIRKQKVKNPAIVNLTIWNLYWNRFN